MAWASQEAERQGSSPPPTGKHKQHTCITLRGKNTKNLNAKKQRQDSPPQKKEHSQVFAMQKYKFEYQANYSLKRSSLPGR